MAAATSNLFTMDLQAGFMQKNEKNKEIFKKLEQKGDKVGEEEIEEILQEVYSRVPVSFQIRSYFYSILYKF